MHVYLETHSQRILYIYQAHCQSSNHWGLQGQMMERDVHYAEFFLQV